MSAIGPYARVYHSIADDSRFERVYGDDRALGTWLRMLLVADAMYPTSAPMPKRTKAVELLIEAGLIVEQPGGRYIVHGLASEREKRTQSARNAAAVRWQSGSNASKAEQNRAEQSIDADASKPNGASPGFMGFRPRTPKPGSHEGQHPGCDVCAPLRPPEPKAAAT